MNLRPAVVVALVALAGIAVSDRSGGTGGALAEAAAASAAVTQIDGPATASVLATRLTSRVRGIQQACPCPLRRTPSTPRIPTS